MHERYAEIESKTVVHVVGDAAVRVAAADLDFESLRRCSPDECDISRQSSEGRLGMPVLFHVRLTCLGLDNSVGALLAEVHVASEYANSGLKSGAVSPILQLSQGLFREPSLYTIINLVPMGYPDVQQSVQQAADHTWMRLCCDKELEDGELRLKT